MRPARLLVASLVLSVAPAAAAPLGISSSAQGAVGSWRRGLAADTPTSPPPPPITFVASALEPHQGLPEPGTGTEAFVAATTPAILLVLGMCGIAYHSARSARAPPPGAIQMIDGAPVPVPRTARQSRVEMSPTLEPTEGLPVPAA